MLTIFFGFVLFLERAFWAHRVDSNSGRMVLMYLSKVVSGRIHLLFGYLLWMEHALYVVFSFSYSILDVLKCFLSVFLLITDYLVTLELVFRIPVALLRFYPYFGWIQYCLCGGIASVCVANVLVHCFFPLNDVFSDESANDTIYFSVDSSPEKSHSVLPVRLPSLLAYVRYEPINTGALEGV